MSSDRAPMESYRRIVLFRLLGLDFFSELFLE